MSKQAPVAPEFFDKSGVLAAWCELMVLAADADGQLAEEERAALCNHIETLTERRLSIEELNTFVFAAERRARGVPRKERLAQISRDLGHEKQRHIAFELTVRVVAADGILRTTERELLLETADALGIPGDVAVDVVRRFVDRK